MTVGYEHVAAQKIYSLINFRHYLADEVAGVAVFV
jgi:hypothetical protein